MALNKVTFFDTTYFKLADTNTEGCKDFVSTDEGTTLSDAGIYFTPKYDETKTNINTRVHHIAHNGHIYTLGSDVIKANNEEVTVNNENSIIPIISSLEADRFEKIIKYASLSIDFSDILNRLSELERIVYGPEPIIDSLPNIVLYYIKYDDNGNPAIVDNETYADIKPETLTSENYDKNNANKILLTETYFNQYTKDTYSDNANYILKHNNGNDITIDSNDNRYDVIGIGLLPNDTYEITNICLADEHNNKYGREITFDIITKTNIIEIDNKQIIKILDKQDTGIRISAIVYKKQQ